jgi:hypothetical protein
MSANTVPPLLEAISDVFTGRAPRRPRGGSSATGCVWCGPCLHPDPRSESESRTATPALTLAAVGESEMLAGCAGERRRVVPATSTGRGDRAQYGSAFEVEGAVT